MKKLIGAAAVGALLIALTGCAGGDGGGAGGGGEGDLIVGFSQVGAESGWRTANTKSIQGAFEDAGIELKFSDAQGKQENQIKAIRSFIQQQVDVIAFSPVVESGWDTVLKEAKDAGIPVVLTDRSVDSEDDSLYESFLGSDLREADDEIVAATTGTAAVVTAGASRESYEHRAYRRDSNEFLHRTKPPCSVFRAAW